MEKWFLDRPALGLLGKEEGFGSQTGGAADLKTVADADRRESLTGILCTTANEAHTAVRSGFKPEEIYFVAPFEGLTKDLLGSCRFVAGGLEDLKLLESLSEGDMVKAGLRLQAPALPELEGSVRLDDLAGIAHEIKALPHLTVRGCFFCGDLRGVHGKELGSFFRAGYEAAKRMTVTLPCAMPYLCFEGAVTALEENRTLHPETFDEALRALDIMTMQNETAFYARLFLSRVQQV